eukprot:7389073-Prymnesium_polylepis.2
MRHLGWWRTALTSVALTSVASAGEGTALSSESSFAITRCSRPSICLWRSSMRASRPSTFWSSRSIEAFVARWRSSACSPWCATWCSPWCAPWCALWCAPCCCGAPCALLCTGARWRTAPVAPAGALTAAPAAGDTAPTHSTPAAPSLLSAALGELALRRLLDALPPAAPPLALRRSSKSASTSTSSSPIRPGAAGQSEE